MKRILVLFATSEGPLKKIAERVGGNLEARGYEIDSRNVRTDAPAGLSGYSAVALVASIHAGSHEQEMLDFVAEHRSDLERVPSLFLSASLAPVSVESEELTEEDREHDRALVRSMLDRFLKETGWNPTELESVTDAVPYARFNPIVRFIRKSVVAEDADWDEIDRLSDDLAALVG